VAGDPGDPVRARRPKTFGRWLRLSLAANGLNADALPLADTLAVAEILELTGRTIPRHVWVDAFDADVEAATLDGLF
jgi:hypothetical protein